MNMARTRVGATLVMAFVAACGGNVANGPSSGTDAGLGDGASPTAKKDGSVGTSKDGGVVVAHPPPVPDGGSPTPSNDSGPVSTLDVAIPPSADAGCTPTLPASFAATQEGLPAPACTAAQITGTAQGCFSDGWTNESCAPYTTGACWSCIQGPASASTWGPFVTTAGSDFIHINYGGCVVAFDPSPAGKACGESYIELEQCFDTACIASCPPAVGAASPYAALDDCESDSETGDCASYQSTFQSACAGVAAAAQCHAMLDATTVGGHLVNIDEYLTLFCGLADAGTIDAGPPDGG
jgi:hypothetical protein